MITHVVCDYVTLDIDLRLFHNGLNGEANYPPPPPPFFKAFVVLCNRTRAPNDLAPSLLAKP